MYRLSMWYRGLSRGTRIGISVLGACLALVMIAVVLYFTLFKAHNVEVRDGTIVYDPVDGHVWEDNTVTLWVDEKDAGNYGVTRIEVLSPEHAAIKEAEEAAKAAEAQRLAESTGYQAVSGVMTEQDLADLQTLQKNLVAMGQNLLTGLDMVNQLNESRNLLVSYRNQVAAMDMPPQFAAVQAQGVAIFDMYIAAVDSYLNYMAYMDPAYLDQAQQYLDQANASWQNLVPQ
jgi:hypothetical protein